jgi:formate dehydrogenase gamma subunit
MDIRTHLSWLLLALILAGAGRAASAAPVLQDSFCLDCHADRTLSKKGATGKEISLFADKAALGVSVHRTNACVSCHTDVTAKHPDDEKAVLPVNCSLCHEKQGDTYRASVHGLALKAGQAGAATCQDCHGTHGVLRATSPDSPLHFSHQAATCGACHDQEARDVQASVHGRASAAGKADAPTCVDCHSEHRIEDLRQASNLKISAAICSRCHASEKMNTRFNLPADRVKTFFESYHGLAAQYGSTLAANCGSCHGYHKILASSDPDSTIHPAHLVATCGRCHPGASEKFALGRIHVDIAAARSGPDLGSQAGWWVRRIYLVLIFGTIGGMLIHNLLVFYRKVSAHLRASGRPVVRMSRGQRWQHAVLALSFIVLAVTGFALKFPDSWLAHALGSSEPFRRWSHRAAGVILLLVGAWHLIYVLVSREGRRLMRDLFPIRKDLADVFGAARYLVGLKRERPKIGRFGYAEKMEYWAVIWGTIIMGVSGLMIWFKMDVTRYLPRWAVEVAVTIHYYEAVLACLAIVVWHFYHVIVDPDVYPLNLACWDGRVSAAWQHEEHPLEATGIPALTAELPTEQRNGLVKTSDIRAPGPASPRGGSDDGPDGFTI